MQRLVIAASILLGTLALPGTANACDSAPYDHNGSLMEAHACNGKFVIAYDQPRSGIVSQGVRSGTVLFTGTISGNQILGIAYVFKRGCEPASYPVSGRMGNNVIILEGYAPVRRDGCRITGGRDDRLVFTGQ
jgi:hypothetical protein